MIEDFDASTEVLCKSLIHPLGGAFVTVDKDTLDLDVNLIEIEIEEYED